jgi:hypothetical protein
MSVPAPLERRHHHPSLLSTLQRLGFRLTGLGVSTEATAHAFWPTTHSRSVTLCWTCCSLLKLGAPSTFSR